MYRARSCAATSPSTGGCIIPSAAGSFRRSFLRTRVTTTRQSASFVLSRQKERFKKFDVASFSSSSSTTETSAAWSPSSVPAQNVSTKVCFQAGDKVWIIDHGTGEEKRVGRIVENRNAGWFAVQLMLDNEESTTPSGKIIKCRGSNLRLFNYQQDAPQSNSPNKGSSTSSFPTNNDSIIHNGVFPPTHITEGLATNRNSGSSDNKNNRGAQQEQNVTSTSPTSDLKWNLRNERRAKDDLVSSAVLQAESVSIEYMQRRHNKNNGTLLLAGATNPPPPMLVDLDAALDAMADNSTDPIRSPFDRLFLEQVAVFQQVRNWIILSDLHTSPATLETCLDVLRQVHDHAKRRHAGILFLGDFWHHRGNTVRVDCLNAVLREFRQWNLPMIMIPGNHDQMKDGWNTHHTLQPFENAYQIKVNEWIDDGLPNVESPTVPGVLIFSRPTKLANAVFVPYIRDNAMMNSLLQEAEEIDKCTALFVHADVYGASMNDEFLSASGITPSIFPPHIPIFSGHFHKPHTVTACQGTVQIQYVGSPYQVSLSEAHQAKHLLVLRHDFNSRRTKQQTQQLQDHEWPQGSCWKHVETVPFDIGRKHFRVSSMFEFLQLRLGSTADNGSYAFKDIGSKQESIQKVVSPGDRVVVFLQKEEMEAYRHMNNKRDTIESSEDVARFHSHMQQLRQGSVAVEIRQSSDDGLSVRDDPDHEKMDTKSALDWEDWSPENVWGKFLQEQASRGALSEVDIVRLREPGLELLRLASTNKTTTTLSENSECPLLIEGEEHRSASSSVSSSVELELESVTMEGFGPFRDRVHYPLANRGLVLLRGTNRDIGSDSNGTGKTSLAMATLWAFTGTLDPRPAKDAKVADVVNDESKAAKVTVHGQLNGIDFSISRTKTASGRGGGLVFIYDGSDLTTLSIKDTQDIIDEKLGNGGAHFLTRIMFHGQHNMNDLLDSTDTKLKDELSLIVPLETWHDAVARARKLSKSAKERAVELEGMIRIKTDDISKLQSRYQEAKMQLDKEVAALRDMTLELESVQTKSMIKVDSGFEEITLDLLETRRQQAERLTRQLEEDRASIVGGREEQTQKERDELKALSVLHDEAVAQHETLRREYMSAVFQLNAAKDRVAELDEMWKIELAAQGSDAIGKFHLPQTCPTCHQSIPFRHGASHDSIMGTNHDHGELLATVKASATKALEDTTRHQTTVERLSVELEMAENTTTALRERKLLAEKAAAEAEMDWKIALDSIDKKLAKTRRESEQAASKLAEAAVQNSKINSLLAMIQGKTDLVQMAENAEESARNEVEGCRKRLKELTEERDAEYDTAALMSELGDAFGQRGVQTFILQSAVESLEASTQVYLEHLSDGAQRLQISLDKGDRILRQAFIRDSNGEYRERPLASLSGGQWRRCSLALNFGFADVVARRGKFRPSLCVLDEPLTHLDRTGRTEVGRLLEKLVRRSNREQRTGNFDHKLSSGLAFSWSTILIVLQDLAAEEIEESFDAIDEVIKRHGVSYVIVDGDES